MQNERAELRQRLVDALVETTAGNQAAYTAEQARAVADIIDATVSTFAATYGMTYRGAFDRIAPGFVRGDATTQALFQEEVVVRKGMERKPDSASAKVITLAKNTVPDFPSMKTFSSWLKDMLTEGGDVVIRSTRQTARFTNANIRASTKRHA